MAAYTFQNAIDIVGKYIKGIPLNVSSTDITISDMINSMIWVSYPWRWTLGSLTSITLVDTTQDYTISDTDFYRSVKMRLTRTDVTPNENYELDVLEYLAVEVAMKGSFTAVRAISRDPQTTRLRLDRAFALPATVTGVINGEYQKVPTKVTALSAAVPFPDQYLNVLMDGLLWKAYQFSDDPRAGTIQYAKNGARLYTGQLGIFRDSLWEMILAEDWGADPSMFPRDPLGVSRFPGNPGLFGF